jgi:hypothetical protein
VDRRAVKAELPLRLVFVDPPADVAFALRSASNELFPPAARSGGALSFDVSVEVRGARPDGSPRLLGPFTHRRPPDRRILVVNSGTLAGQRDSCWTRAALVPLAGISWELIEQALAQNRVLEARLPGTSRDGGPVCATVKFSGWQLVPQASQSRT